MDETTYKPVVPFTPLANLVRLRDFFSNLLIRDALLFFSIADDYSIFSRIVSGFELASKRSLKGPFD